ncbi:MAG: TetR family transcriptional regulator [Gemmatimonadetes bacterium]|nr:TetR family transcriptional regulator [Gemmatimonadota bacterium]
METTTDTEQRILDAATRVFIRRGTAGARMQEIAAEAEVTQALVHYYFRTKEALAERVFLTVARRTVGSILPLLSQPLPLEQLIEQFVVGYIDAVRQAPFLPGYMLAEAQQHPERLELLFNAVVGVVPSAAAQAALQHIEQQIAERSAAGTMRAMPARQLFANVAALCVFPFVARPVLQLAFGLDDAGFAAFLDERRRELPTFILNALRP